MLQSAALLWLALAACGEDSRLSWEITGTDDAYTIEAEVRRGGCASSDVAYIARGPVSAWMPSAVPRLGRGTWGFAADAVDDECRHIGFGCTEIVLPSPTTLITTAIEPMEPLDLCSDELCQNGSCVSRPDAGVPRMDAGPIVLPDAGRPDTGFDAGREGCARYPEAVLCETFDEPPLERGWLTLGDESRVQLVPMARSGLALETTAGPLGWAALQAEFDTDRFGPGERFFVRWYMYIDATAAAIAPGGTFTTLSVTSDTSPTDGPMIRYVRSRFELDAPAASGISAGFPTDRWFCAELEVAVDPVMGSVSLSVDGGGARMISPAQTLPAGGDIEMVLVGIYSPSASSQGRILFDELVISRDSIGCD